MKPLVIVQSRLGSTRLPGKVMMTLGTKPVLWHVMERVKMAGFPYILTIPADPSDDPLALYAQENGWPLSRGPHPDMLAAFYQAWKDAGAQADKIVRVTADCPFLQYEEIQRYMGFEVYASNAHPDRTVPKGFDVEGFGAGLLLTAHLNAKTEHERHHVTPWMRTRYGLGTSDTDGEFRVTLDTPEDLIRLRDIASVVDITPPGPTIEDLRAYFTFRSNG